MQMIATCFPLRFWLVSQAIIKSLSCGDLAQQLSFPYLETIQRRRLLFHVLAFLYLPKQPCYGSMCACSKPFPPEYVVVLALRPRKFEAMSTGVRLRNVQTYNPCFWLPPFLLATISRQTSCSWLLPGNTRQMVHMSSSALLALHYITRTNQSYQ